MLLKYLSTDYCAKGFTVILFNRQNEINMFKKVIQPFVGSGNQPQELLKNSKYLLIMLNILPALKLL